jgi:hypothetical protein
MSGYDYVPCDIYTVAMFPKIDLYVWQTNADTNEIWKAAQNAIQKHDILSHAILS